MESINSNKLRRAMNDVLNRVEFKGESFHVTRYGRQSAVLAPIAERIVVTDPAVALPPGATVGKAQEPEAPAALSKNPPKNPRRNSRKTR